MTQFKQKPRLSRAEIVKALAFLAVLLTLLSMKHIFPNSSFVRKYFTGLWGVVWFCLFWIVVLGREFIIYKKKKGDSSDGAEGEGKN